MMARCYVLYNPLSASGNGAAEAKKLAEMWKEKKPELMDITKIQHYRDFMSSLEADDVVALCGGDGTLNRFVNDLGDLEVKNEVYYFATGTGNDFLHDLGKTKEDGPVLINEYIKDLPIVTVKGQSYRFINGVGYGIDGYCCEVGDKIHEKSDKPDKAEKIEKTDKKEKASAVKQERPQKKDKKGEKSEKGEKGEKTEKGEKAPAAPAPVQEIERPAPEKRFVLSRLTHLLNRQNGNGAG